MINIILKEKNISISVDTVDEAVELIEKLQSKDDGFKSNFTVPSPAPVFQFDSSINTKLCDTCQLKKLNICANSCVLDKGKEEAKSNPFEIDAPLKSYGVKPL